MKSQILWSILLVSAISFNCSVLPAGDYTALEGAGAGASRSESGDDSSEDSGLLEDDDSQVHALRFVFKEEKLLLLSGIVKTEKEFLALPIGKRSDILAQFPDFQTFLQINDTAGQAMPVGLGAERLEFHNRAVVVPLEKKIAKSELPSQLFDGSMPCATCTPLLHITQHTKEMNAILAQDDEGEASSRNCVKRVFQSLRRRLQRR